MPKKTPTPLASDLTGIAKLADTKLAKSVYRDALRPATLESGKVLGEVAKTTRMVLQPLLRAIQGGAKRLDSWVAEAVKQVPPERRVEAKPAILNETIAAIGVQEDTSEMRRYYVRLLASLIDEEQQDGLHPAFPRILAELSAIDAFLLQITPYVGGFVPDFWSPDGMDPREELRFGSGVIDVSSAVRERLFVKLDRRKFRGVDQPAKTETTHVGFIEIPAPPPMNYDDLARWSNLLRTNLVKEHQPPGEEGMFDDDGQADSHLAEIRSIELTQPSHFGLRTSIFSS